MSKESICGLLLALAGIMRSASAAPFTPGNLVIYRVGDGSAALSSAAAAVFLDEYTPTGTLVQSIAMPVAGSGSNHALTASGSASSEGLLNLSSDGQFITVTGYDAVPGTASVAGTSSSTIARVVGVIGANGSVNTTTALDAYSGNNVRSVVSTNGTNLWVSGQTTGVVYTTTGSTGTNYTAVSATTSRQIDIFGGQLYVSSTSGSLAVGTVGSGLPTTSGQTVTNLPGISHTNSPSPFQFVLADLSPLVAGFDTLYIADDSSPTTSTGGLQKWSLVSGTWTFNNFIAITNLRGLTGLTLGGTEQLFGTTGGSSTTTSSLIGFSDATGYNQNLVGTPLTLATAGTNTVFRGLDFTPGTAPVPEPSTLALLDLAAGAGLLSLLRRYFRRS